jgi:hypothetical protein
MRRDDHTYGSVVLFCRNATPRLLDITVGLRINFVCNNHIELRNHRKNWPPKPRAEAAPAMIPLLSSHQGTSSVILE